MPGPAPRSQWSRAILSAIEDASNRSIIVARNSHAGLVITASETTPASTTMPAAANAEMRREFALTNFDPATGRFECDSAIQREEDEQGGNPEPVASQAPRESVKKSARLPTEKTSQPSRRSVFPTGRSASTRAKGRRRFSKPGQGVRVADDARDSWDRRRNQVTGGETFL